MDTPHQHTQLAYFRYFLNHFILNVFKNKGYQYHLGRETKQAPPIDTRKSKKKRKEQFYSLLKENK